MAEVGGAYVRIRPLLGHEEREALAHLADLSRKLADGLDAFLDQFPAPKDEIEEPHD